MNEEKGRLEKYLIDCHTGKFAKSDEPETWTDYETACKYASENGGVTLAFALDGKDGIACIDLDGCIDENGKRSATSAMHPLALTSSARCIPSPKRPRNSSKRTA